MDERTRRENQLVVAGAFFRKLAAEDASGMDLALGQTLMEILARAGVPPESIQYSCAFDGSERAAGRFLFGWLPEQLDVHGGDVAVEDVYRSLVATCEFPGYAGVEAAAAQLAAPAVRCAWLGFDAGVPPERTRTRLALSLAPGEGGRKLVAGLLRELGLPPETLRSAEVASEVAIDHGPDGLVDVRVAWPVAPATIARHVGIAADPLALALVTGAGSARLVRSARAAHGTRLVFLYGPGGTADARLTELARRSPLAADLRDEVRQANRGLPPAAGLTVRPWGTTLAMEGGRPRTDRVAVLFRPVPVDV
jgi:hypothetical protein